MPQVSRREVDAIQEAMVNADRYYRLMATGPGLGPTQWRDMSQAFKNVARKYLVRAGKGWADQGICMGLVVLS